MDKYGVPYWPRSGRRAVCLAAGFLFGLPALRLEGLYLALATLHWACRCRSCSNTATWKSGPAACRASPSPSRMRRLSFRARPGAGQDQWLYFFTLAVAAVMFLFAWNCCAAASAAPWSRSETTTSPRDHGVNNAMIKSLTFGISPCTPGRRRPGAIAVQFVAPDSFNIFLSIIFLIGIVIGGLASISCPLRALFIQFVPNIATRSPRPRLGDLRPVPARFRLCNAAGWPAPSASAWRLQRKEVNPCNVTEEETVMN